MTLDGDLVLLDLNQLTSCEDALTDRNHVLQTLKMKTELCRTTMFLVLLGRGLWGGSEGSLRRTQSDEDQVSSQSIKYKSDKEWLTELNRSSQPCVERSPHHPGLTVRFSAPQT